MTKKQLTQEDRNFAKAYRLFKEIPGAMAYYDAFFNKTVEIVKSKLNYKELKEELEHLREENAQLKQSSSPGIDTTGGYGRQKQQSQSSSNPNVKAEMDKLTKLNDESTKKVQELQAELDKYKNALLGKGNESEVLVTNLKKVEAEKNALQSQITKLSEENTELNHKVNEMSMKLKSLDKANEANKNASQEYINKIELQIYNTSDIIIELITKVLTVVGASQEDFERNNNTFEQTKNDRLNLTTYASYAKEEILDKIRGLKNIAKEFVEDIDMKLIEQLLEFANTVGYKELSGEIASIKSSLENADFLNNTDAFQLAQPILNLNEVTLQTAKNEFSNLKDFVNNMIDNNAKQGAAITNKLSNKADYDQVNDSLKTIFETLYQWLLDKADEVKELQENVQQNANIDVDAFQSKIDELTNHLTTIQQKLIEYLDVEFKSIDLNTATRIKSYFERLISNDEPILNQVEFVLNMFANNLAVARKKLSSIDQEKRYVQGEYLGISFNEIALHNFAKSLQQSYALLLANDKTEVINYHYYSVASQKMMKVLMDEYSEEQFALKVQFTNGGMYYIELHYGETVFPFYITEDMKDVFTFFIQQVISANFIVGTDVAVNLAEEINNLPDDNEIKIRMNQISENVEWNKVDEDGNIIEQNNGELHYGTFGGENDNEFGDIIDEWGNVITPVEDRPDIEREEAEGRRDGNGHLVDNDGNIIEYAWQQGLVPDGDENWVDQDGKVVVPAGYQLDENGFPIY
ncbi:hypothetical protein TVAG_225600 [Trichomonas vaginalis G3]|uniref:Uncharacterized protein n=1 Tax=Trichomonas vaginalis (strain ATCC PRA-98 / G3) TaxID=412133 RepID=A2DNT9_TRIV3|nr:hypothetical protein TVAGG3_0289030 [Trichomonas vaginalis G3]EAY17934.1 hypothetical protein TVAG_225600 [Trichomonas vaginalis G3]KAI5527114.1 hypothetical protein TVAGG3_0289030 [Trichomonas vaginalis G3]|eukprot:XP_001578920.1 hypothetical protein [Trichomonas vaginalis G3]